MVITAPYKQAETRPLEEGDIEPVIAHLGKESDRAFIRYRRLLEGPSTAFLIDGQVVAAGGFSMVHLGVADPWLVITREGKTHFRPLYRAVVQWLIAQRSAYGLHRLQAFPRADDQPAIRLLQHLGFGVEGVARQLGPDREDYYMYAWTKRD